jgi:metal-responsive CopG/Arc/MetJ family transcriptional regulator
MKVAVSIPQDVFDDAERLARASGRSRSRVYAEAVREYVARHSADEVTERIDRALSEIGPEEDGGELRRVTARRVLRAADW